MDNGESSGFRMRIDGEDTDTEYEEQIGDLRISKLSQRVTIITILIPCLFGAMLFFAYLNMKKDVDTTFISEAEEVRKLSKVFESRLSALSLENKTREESLAGKLSDIDKTIGSLKGKVEQNRKKANTITATKASKKAVSASVSKIDTSITGLQQDLVALSKEIKDLDTTLKGELGGLADALDQQEQDDEGLRKELVDLAVQLDDLQKTYQQKLNQVKKVLEAKIVAVQKEIGRIERTQPKTESLPRTTPKKITSPAPATVPGPIPGPADAPAQSPVAPKPGTIIEQDID